MILGWLSLGHLVLGVELFEIGRHAADNAQQMCQAVSWGVGTRELLRLGKSAFIGLAYICTTIGAIAWSVRQHRRFMELDEQNATMMDYAAFCSGFPREKGDGLEEEYKRFFA